jgi:hypothetical protein
MKRQKITVGSIIRFSLPCGKFGYGRILNNANYAFYDLITSEEEDNVVKIAECKILFIVAVYNDAINSGRWLKIGKIDLENDLLNLPLKFIQDTLNPSVFELYNPNTGEIRRAALQDCIGLERAAVWETFHVEERICDHYDDKTNKWVEKMKLKID